MLELQALRCKSGEKYDGFKVAQSVATLILLLQLQILLTQYAVQLLDLLANDIQIVGQLPSY
jgi:hypothetical protein